jgi:hypothetical protein
LSKNLARWRVGALTTANNREVFILSRGRVIDHLDLRDVDIIAHRWLMFCEHGAATTIEALTVQLFHSSITVTHTGKLVATSPTPKPPGVKEKFGTFKLFGTGGLGLGKPVCGGSELQRAVQEMRVPCEGQLPVANRPKKWPVVVVAPRGEVRRATVMFWDETCASDSFMNFFVNHKDCATKRVWLTQ